MCESRKLLNGADSFDDRGPADYVCDGPCNRTIYSGLLTQVDGRMLCQRCEPLPTYSWNSQKVAS